MLLNFLTAVDNKEWILLLTSSRGSVFVFCGTRLPLTGTALKKVTSVLIIG